MTLTTRPVTESPRAARNGWSPIVLVTAVIGLVLVVIALGLLIVKGTGGHSTAGSGVAAAERRTVTGFTGVEVAGALNVNVLVGGVQRVVVHADDNLLDRITTQVRSRTLVVDTHGSFTTNSPAYVDVTVPVLGSAELSGTGRLLVSSVTAGTFTAKLSGTGVLRASGRADQVESTVSGAGDLQLGSLIAKHVKVALAGTGRATVHATTSLDATMAGTGAIIYTGNPTKVTTGVSGTGTITAG